MDQIDRRSRRMEGGKLLRAGWTQAEVARHLGVSRETARRWAQTLAAEGLPGLKRVGEPGRPAGLDRRQRKQLRDVLGQGALAQGLDSDRWTLAAAGQVIENLFGRCYSPAQVWRILRAEGWRYDRSRGFVPRRGAGRNG
jgi:transposase